MKVLLIEDNPADQGFVKELVGRFQGARYDLVIEDRLGKGLGHFNDGEIAVILLDLNLPDSRGLETFTTVQRLAGHIPIIILTGIEDDGLALKAVEGGAQDYLVKGNINTEILQKAVQYAIERHRILRELKKTAFRLKQEEEAQTEGRKQLEISENLYRTVFESTGAATAILDEKGTIIRANSEAEKLFGYAPEELEGKIHWSKFVSPDELPRLTGYWRLLHEDPASSNQHYEAKLVDRWGRIRYGILSVRLIPNTGNCIVSIADITESRRADEAISESEERFRGLFDHMASGVAVYQAIDGGQDFIFQDFNAAAEKIEGMPKKDLIGKRVTEVFPGVRDFGLLDVIQNVWKTGIPAYLPPTLYHDEARPGGWRENWVYRLPSGEIVAVYNDVTERMQAEEAIRESEEKYRSLYESMIDAYASVDMSGRIVQFNEAFSRMVGYGKEEIPSLTYTDLTPERWHAFEADILKNQVMIRGYSDIYEKEYVRKDGTIFPVELRSYLVRDKNGTPLGMWAIVRDVTERKRAEEALKESEEKFRTVVENVPDLILVHRDGKILYVNNAAIYTLEFPVSELLNKPIFDFIVPEYHDRVLEAMRRRGAGEWVEPYEIKIRWKYGEKTVVISGSRIEYEGKPATLNILTDITERKQAEEALRLTQFSVDTAGDAILWLRPDGSFSYGNEAACRLLGYAREELLSKAAPDLNTAHPRGAWQAYWEELRRKGVMTFENTLLRKDGRQVPVEITANYLEFEGEEFNCSFLRDLTERKKAEEKIAHLASFPELNPNPVIELDSSGEIIYTNPALTATLGKLGLGSDPRVFLPSDFETILPLIMEGDVQREVVVGGRIFIETIALASQKGTIRIYTRDITDRKRAEDELRESQANLSEAMDIANLVNWEFDVPTQIFTFNDRFYALYGTTAEREGGYQMSAERYAREFCHPDDMHLVAEEVRRAIETPDPGYTANLEHRIVRRDGAVRQIVVRIRITKDAEGRTIKTHGANQDITERKKSEEALKASEAYLKTIFESVQTGLVLIDPESHIIVDANPVAVMMAGAAKQDLIGSKCHKFICPAEEGACPITNKGQRVDNSERVFLRSDGTKMAVLKTVIPVSISGHEYLLENFTDISSRKQAEEALRESEEKYRNLVELAGAGIAIVQDGRVAFANRSLGQIWGGGAEELIRIPLGDLVHPDERTKILERYVKRMAGEEVPSVYETTFLRRDGTMYPAEVHAAIINYLGRPADLILIQDITERKRADRALQESKEQYRQIVEGTNAGVWVFDNELSTIYANEQMGAMLGAVPTEMLGRSISDFVFPDDRASMNEVFAKIGKGQDPDTVMRFRRKDQLASWLRVSAGPLYGVQGQRVGFTGIFSDVTRSRLAEEAVRKAEEKYRSIFEFAVEGIYQINTKGRFLTVNSAMARILGYGSPQEIIGTVIDTAHQLWADPGQRREYLRLLKQDGHVNSFEAEFFRKDGSRIWVSLNTRAVKGPDGAIVYSEGTLEDITGRKKVEQALKESEEMYRNPVEQSPVGVFLARDGVLLYANPKLAEMTGFPVQDIVGKPFESLIHPDDMPKLLGKMAGLLRGEVGSDEIEFRSIRKDGSIIEVQAYGSSMAFRGRPAIYGTIIDITERKKMANQISESLKEKEVLLREIHHRVKNNMQVISSLLSVQSQNIRDESVRGLFKESQNRIRSIALVHELLYRSDNLDQIEYGAYLKKMFIPLFESYSVDQRKVSMSIEAPSVMITIDKAVPCSLIMNELISNSLKHAFPGDRKGTISISFSLDSAKSGYTLDYGDDGVGLPPGLDITKLNSLGMRLINGLTKQLGGTLEVSGNGGTRYHITFPAGSGKEGGGR